VDGKPPTDEQCVLVADLIRRSEMSDVEIAFEDAKAFRRLLWMRHGCPPSAWYADDGEMQCGMCGIDFMREPPLLIHHKLKLMAEKRRAAFVKAKPMEKPCECVNWCDLDPRIRILTGHNVNCDKSGNLLDAALGLVNELVDAIGLPDPKSSPAYRRAGIVSKGLGFVSDGNPPWTA
jgi:hypothetical protein